METNPYVAPEALVSDLPAIPGEQAPAFAVSTTKFAVMCLSTMGLYSVYWFYKHWVAIRSRNKESIWPVWRAIFSVIWAYSCFKAIEVEARRQGITRPLGAAGLAIGWAVLNIAARLPDPLWLVSLLAFLFLLPVQNLANELNAKVAPQADRNSRFTAANIAWLAIAGLWWTLVIGGLMLPDQPTP
jgi:hypothetical protein